MNKYNHKEIDKKWQDKWEKEGVYKTKDEKSKPKYYVKQVWLMKIWKMEDASVVIQKLSESLCVNGF
jgi:hypothetical protein